MNNSKTEYEFNYDQIFWNDYECIVTGIFLPFDKKPTSKEIIIKFVSVKNDLPLDVTDLSEDQIVFFKQEVIKRWDLIRYRQRFHS